MKKAEQSTNCESCMHFLYDENVADYACEMELDEDEMLLYATQRFRHCPYYRYHDEYLSVRKQI